jgi:hypothetical protein
MKGKASSKQYYQVWTGFRAFIITIQSEPGGRLLFRALGTAF